MQPADPNFVKRVEAILTVVNKQSEADAAAWVNLSLVFSAARYSAWLCHSMSQSPDEMAQKRQESIDVFTEDFRKLFAEAYDEHTDNWATYRGVR